MSEILFCRHCDRTFFTKTCFNFHNESFHQIEKKKLTLTHSNKLKDIEEVNVKARSAERTTTGWVPPAPNDQHPDMIGAVYGKTSQSYDLHEGSISSELLLRTSATAAKKKKKREEASWSSFKNETTSKEEEGNKCRFCAEMFATKFHLKTHLSSHKKLECTLCAKTFGSRSRCRDHINVAHEKKFECKICQLKFRSKVGLKYHNFRVHEKPKLFE